MDGHTVVHPAAAAAYTHGAARDAGPRENRARQAGARMQHNAGARKANAALKGARDHRTRVATRLHDLMAQPADLVLGRRDRRRAAAARARRAAGGAAAGRALAHHAVAAAAAAAAGAAGTAGSGRFALRLGKRGRGWR